MLELSRFSKYIPVIFYNGLPSSFYCFPLKWLKIENTDYSSMCLTAHFHSFPGNLSFVYFWFLSLISRSCSPSLKGLFSAPYLCFPSQPLCFPSLCQRVQTKSSKHIYTGVLILNPWCLGTMLFPDLKYQSVSSALSNMFLLIFQYQATCCITDVIFNSPAVYGESVLRKPAMCAW